MISFNLLKPPRMSRYEPRELEMVLGPNPLPFCSLPSDPGVHYLRIIKGFFSGMGNFGRTGTGSRYHIYLRQGHNIWLAFLKAEEAMQMTS